MKHPKTGQIITDHVLIKGTDLTDDQKSKLKFHGMSNPEWIANHSFWFKGDVPATEESGLYYPICHSISHLPY